MSKRAPGKFEHRENDFYPTPAKAVVPLIPHLRLYNIRRFCEPCRGDGRLVKYLESFGLTCVLASDIAEGQDALDIPSFPAPVITNPPHTWKLLRRLIEHFMANAPCAWLLIPSDWMSNERTQRLMTHCSDSVPVRRLREEGTASSGMDNFVWLRFAAEHTHGPIFHVKGASPSKLSMRCPAPHCGRLFMPTRVDAQYCRPACKQRAYRERLSRNAAVTASKPTNG